MKKWLTMNFDPTDPISLKVVYWINFVIFILLVIAGVAGSVLFSPKLALYGYVGAIIYWYLLTSPLKRKKKWSYWFNLVWSAVWFIDRISGFFLASDATLGAYAFGIVHILLTVLIMYLLLRKEVRDIFIGTKQKAAVSR